MQGLAPSSAMPSGTNRTGPSVSEPPGSRTSEPFLSGCMHATLGCSAETISNGFRLNFTNFGRRGVGGGGFASGLNSSNGAAHVGPMGGSSQTGMGNGMYGSTSNGGMMGTYGGGIGMGAMAGSAHPTYSGSSDPLSQGVLHSNPFGGHQMAGHPGTSGYPPPQLRSSTAGSGALPIPGPTNSHLDTAMHPADSERFTSPSSNAAYPPQPSMTISRRPSLNGNSMNVVSHDPTAHANPKLSLPSFNHSLAPVSTISASRSASPLTSPTRSHPPLKIPPLQNPLQPGHEARVDSLSHRSPFSQPVQSATQPRTSLDHHGAPVDMSRHPHVPMSRQAPSARNRSGSASAQTADRHLQAPPKAQPRPADAHDDVHAGHERVNHPPNREIAATQTARTHQRDDPRLVPSGKHGGGTSSVQPDDDKLPGRPEIAAWSKKVTKAQTQTGQHARALNNAHVKHKEGRQPTFSKLERQRSEEEEATSGKDGKNSQVTTQEPHPGVALSRQPYAHQEVQQTKASAIFDRADRPEGKETVKGVTAPPGAGKSEVGRTTGPDSAFRSDPVRTHPCTQAETRNNNQRGYLTGSHQTDSKTRQFGQTGRPSQPVQVNLPGISNGGKGSWAGANHQTTQRTHRQMVR